MKCNLKNSCMGGYGKCLDVKITNSCNAACTFCIERGGYSPSAASVEEMIASAVNEKDYQTVLILGGEPLMYPYLETYLKGIRPFKEKIYITTNGSLLTEEMAAMLAKYLDGINVSIHYFTEQLNDALYQTAHVSFDQLKRAIAVLHAAGVPVRFNTNLVSGYIDTARKARSMIAFASKMGVDEIRFSELQDNGDSYVDARSLFDGLTSNPYRDGCEQTIGTTPIKVRVKMTCGCVNPRKAPIVREEKTPEHCKVQYPNAAVTPGWVSTKTDEEVTCPGRTYGPDCCHPRRLGAAFIPTTGCHGPRAFISLGGFH